MAPRLAQLVVPSRSTALFALIYLAARRTRLVVPRSLQRLLAVLLLLNWTALPGYWHWRVWIRVLLVARREQLLAYFGWHSGKAGGRSRELGLAKRWWHLQSMAISPYEATSYTEGKVGWAQSDLFLHMSNSCYPAAMDEARFMWAVRFLGPPLHFEKMALPLAGVSSVFFKEINMFSRFTVETIPAAFTDRWSFLLCLFTIPVSRKPRPTDIIIDTPRGKRTLCCIGLCKNCCKIPGVRQALVPTRVLSASGFGPDAANWTRIQALRESGKAKEWLASKDGPDGMDLYKEQNERALEVIGRLGGGEQKAVWLELLQLVRSFHPAASPSQEV